MAARCGAFQTRSSVPVVDSFGCSSAFTNTDTNNQHRHPPRHSSSPPQRRSGRTLLVDRQRCQTRTNPFRRCLHVATSVHHPGRAAAGRVRQCAAGAIRVRAATEQGPGRGTDRRVPRQRLYLSDRPFRCALVGGGPGRRCEARSSSTHGRFQSPEGRQGAQSERIHADGAAADPGRRRPQHRSHQRHRGLAAAVDSRQSQFLPRVCRQRWRWRLAQRELLLGSDHLGAGHRRSGHRVDRHRRSRDRPEQPRRDLRRYRRPAFRHLGIRLRRRAQERRRRRQLGRHRPRRVRAQLPGVFVGVLAVPGGRQSGGRSQQFAETRRRHQDRPVLLVQRGRLLDRSVPDQSLWADQQQSAPPGHHRPAGAEFRRQHHADCRGRHAWIGDAGAARPRFQRSQRHLSRQHARSRLSDRLAVDFATRQWLAGQYRRRHRLRTDRPHRDRRGAAEPEHPLCQGDRSAELRHHRPVAQQRRRQHLAAAGDAGELLRLRAGRPCTSTSTRVHSSAAIRIAC